MSRRDLFIGALGAAALVTSLDVLAQKLSEYVGLIELIHLKAE